MRQVRVMTAPAAMPVTLAEAKLDARIDGSDEDTLLTGLIAAATAEAEDLAGRSFVTRTLELALDEWPADGLIRLPLPPAASVVSVKHYDGAGTLQTVAGSNYVAVLDVTPGIVAPAAGCTWPSDLRVFSPIRVQYTAGYGLAAAVPEIYKRLIRALVMIDYEHRERMTPDGQRQRELVRARLQMDWGW